jgi:hypothetical protein
MRPLRGSVDDDQIVPVLSQAVRGKDFAGIADRAISSSETDMGS